jgi:hypothetical protein
MGWAVQVPVWPADWLSWTSSSLAMVWYGLGLVCPLSEMTIGLVGLTTVWFGRGMDWPL